MALKGINKSEGPVSFTRYGDLKGMLPHGIIAVGGILEVLAHQEVNLTQGEIFDIVNGFEVGGGTVNGKEIHEVTRPIQAGGIIGMFYLSDIKGAYLDETEIST